MAYGAELAWLIVTSIFTVNGWKQEQVERRAAEIARVIAMFGFDHVFTLDFPTTKLDRIPVGDLVGAISGVFKAFQPEEVFVPHPSDVHTDHRGIRCGRCLHQVVPLSLCQAGDRSRDAVGDRFRIGHRARLQA